MTGTNPPPAVLGICIDFPNTEEERPHEKQAEAEMVCIISMSHASVITIIHYLRTKA